MGKGSEAACSRKNQSPRMTIKFTCCDTLGTPRIHGAFPDAECRYNMEWCTSAACPAKRRQVALTANTFVDPLSNEKITISQRETFLVTGDVRQLQSNSQKKLQVSDQPRKQHRFQFI